MIRSNPTSERYGKYYSPQMIHAMFAPHKDTVEAVKEWLHSSGIAEDRVSQSINKQWLQFDATTGEVESLIKAEYYHYEHYNTGKTNIGTDEYGLSLLDASRVLIHL